MLHQCVDDFVMFVTSVLTHHCIVEWCQFVSISLYAISAYLICPNLHVVWERVVLKQKIDGLQMANGAGPVQCCDTLPELDNSFTIVRGKVS